MASRPDDAGLLLFAWRDCVFRVSDAVQPPKAGSLFFCRHLAAAAGERVLEIGAGLGLAAVLAARAGARVVATDVVPAAVEAVRVNAALNGVVVDARVGDCYAPVAGERFDLICTNPPQMPTPIGRERDDPVAAGAGPGEPGGPLDGRVAIVTGAAGGLGTAICRSLRAAGAAVVPVDLRGEGCLIADVATAAGNRRMVDAALQRHGRLDILVLNAGAQAMNPIASYVEEDWDRLLGLMAKGPFLAMKFAWPHLTRQPGGRIIVISSTAGLQAVPFKAAYVAAKHAVIGLAKVAALEGAAHGLTANAVAPGWMDTPLLQGQIGRHVSLRGIGRDQVIAAMMAEQPAHRFVDTGEVAALVTFLASSAASAINGTCIPVDTGAMAT